MPDSKPTPTQEECDLAKLGVPIELADDGSGPDPHAESNAKALAAANRKPTEAEKARAQTRR